jgi:hypothetical protein
MPRLSRRQSNLSRCFVIYLLLWNCASAPTFDPKVPVSDDVPLLPISLSVACIIDITLLFCTFALCTAMMLSGSSGSGSGSASSSAQRRDAQSQRQRDHRANLAAGQVQARRQADAVQHRDARAAAQEEQVQARRQADAVQHRDARAAAQEEQVQAHRQANAAQHRDARAAAQEEQVQAHRQANAAQHRDVRAAAQEERSAHNAQIEAELPHSYRFTEAELEYAAEKFEQSPVAALAFLAANTGIANTPEDLGPLLDGVPDPAPLIAAFKQRTERPLRGCACCGMRSYNCKPLTTLDQIDAHQMSARETTEYDALPEVLRQVRSTCVIAGSRYMLHPELVHIAPGTDTCPRPLPLLNLVLSLILSHFHAGVLQTDARFHRSCVPTALERATRFTRCL